MNVSLNTILDKMKPRLKATGSAASQVWKEFSNDDGPQAAAAFSFYAFLSLLALLVLSGAVLGMVLSGRPELMERIMTYISDNLPGITDTISAALDSSVNLKGVLGIAGILGLLYSGTKIFDSFQVWLNGIWDAEKPKFLKKKLKSLVIMAFMGGVVALGLGVHLALFIMRRYFDFLNSLMSILAFAITVLVLFVGLTFAYFYAVEAKLGWRRAWKGALFSAILINPVQMGLSWYYSNMGNLSAIYGSFAGVILTIIVIYYVGYIIYLGAELNRYLDKERPRGGR